MNPHVEDGTNLSDQAGVTGREDRLIQVPNLPFTTRASNSKGFFPSSMLNQYRKNSPSKLLQKHIERQQRAAELRAELLSNKQAQLHQKGLRQEAARSRITAE